jgi:hypothetical protein
MKEKGKGKKGREGGERGVVKEGDSTTQRPVAASECGGSWSGTEPGIAPQSERWYGRSEAHGRTDTFLDEKVEVRPFLTQAFGPHVDPFLDIMVPRQTHRSCTWY